MPRDVIPQETLHLLILKTLARGAEMHGFEIAEHDITGSCPQAAHNCKSSWRNLRA
jgi:hypothetical protein